MACCQARGTRGRGDGILGHCALRIDPFTLSSRDHLLAHEVYLTVTSHNCYTILLHDLISVIYGIGSGTSIHAHYSLLMLAGGDCLDNAAGSDNHQGVVILWFPHGGMYAKVPAQIGNVADADAGAGGSAGGLITFEVGAVHG